MPAKKRKRSAKAGIEGRQTKKVEATKSKKAKSQQKSTEAVSNQTEEPSPETFDGKLSWFDMPKEIRLHILSFTDIVVREHPHHVVPDLRIHNGKILPNTRCSVTKDLFEDDYEEWDTTGVYRCRYTGHYTCSCTNTPAAILDVRNKLFHNEAVEILLSYNRLVFEPQKPQRVLKWLEAQGDMVRKIRQLDIQFSVLEPNDEQAIIPRCHNWKKNSGAQYRNWKALVAFIRDNLFLERLELSLDGGLDLVVYRECVDAHSTLTMNSDLKDTYQKIIKPFRDFGPKKRLKSFHIFLASDAQQELKAERFVMGPNWIPTDKKCPRHREPYYPHDPPQGHRESLERRLLRDRQEEDWMEEHALWYDEMWDEEDFDSDDFDDFGFSLGGQFGYDPMDMFGTPYVGHSTMDGPPATD